MNAAILSRALMWRVPAGIPKIDMFMLNEWKLKHIRLHGDTEGVLLGVEDQAIEGEALVPEKVQEERKCWVVLQRYKYKDI